MASIINIHANGALKQGDVLFAFQFETGSIWTLAICDIDGKKILFGKHSSEGGFTPLHAAKLEGSGWLKEAGISDYAKSLIPYALPETQTVGKAYVAEAKEIGLYTDGKGAISTTPYVPKDTTDTIKEILGGSNTSGSSTTDTPAANTPFYKKPMTYIILAGVLILGYFGFKAYAEE